MAGLAWLGPPVLLRLDPSRTLLRPSPLPVLGSHLRGGGRRAGWMRRGCASSLHRRDYQSWGSGGAGLRRWMPCHTAVEPLVLSNTGEQTPASTGALVAAFHLSKANLEWFARKPSLFSPSRGAASLKVAVYAGCKGTTYSISSGRLLSKATISLDLKGAEAKPAVPHNGWISIGKCSGKGSSAAAELSLTVRAEPDPRFVFEFDGEPECSPQVLQVRGSMKHPMFTCKFGCRSNSDLQRSVVQPEREAAGKERKGWSVMVHDLSGSPVALASMVTPFVASSGTDRVSRSNLGTWLILRPTDDGAWEPWAHLECWRECGGAGAADSLGYCFEILPGVDHAVPLAESSIVASKGGKFSIDLRALQPLSWGSGDFSQWPLGNYRGFVMSTAVQGDRRCSKPTKDAAAFVDLSIYIMSTPHQQNMYMWMPHHPKPGWFRKRG